MIEVVPYTKNKRREWDEFVEYSDNLSFLFYRDYLEYHSDRFDDFSLMIYENNKLKSLIPANLKVKKLISHQGLTYGGILLPKHITFEKAKLYFDNYLTFLCANDIKELTIKPQPFFYSKSLTQIQTFLFENLNFKKESPDIGTFINCQYHSFPKSTIEKRKLNLDNFYIDENVPIEEYWKVLEQNLHEQHKSNPIHTINEIIQLKEKFPKNISLFCIRNKTSNQIDAGILAFTNGGIVKMQYIASSSEGRTNRATHALYYLFICHYRKRKQFIDMGTCMSGDNINTSLLYLKQRYGADIYTTSSCSLNLNHDSF